MGDGNTPLFAASHQGNVGVKIGLKFMFLRSRGPLVPSYRRPPPRGRPRLVVGPFVVGPLRGPLAFWPHGLFVPLARPALGLKLEARHFLRLRPYAVRALYIFGK